MVKKLNAEQRRFAKHQNKLLLRKWISKNKPRIIGLDISTSCTGVCVLASKVVSGHCTPKGDRRERIFVMEDFVKTFIKKHKPNIAFIEDYSLSLHASSVVQIAECGGIIKNVLYKDHIPMYHVTPQTLKKFVLGEGKGQKAKGKQAKSLILMETLDKWGVKFTNDDECDAFCLAQFGRELMTHILKDHKLTKWKQKMYDDFLTMRGDVF